VVIEEQTTDHLRFRLPTFHPPKWRWAMGLCLILFGTGELCPLINMIFRVTNRVPNVIFAVFLGLSGITIITIGVYFWIGVKTFDLRPMHLTIQTSMGHFSFLRKYQVAKIRRISARTPDLKGNFLQEFIASNSQSACRVKFRFRTIYLASGHPPETARFVTQLIRRQLKTMGHELADEA